jgi:hypothetical protein
MSHKESDAPSPPAPSRHRSLLSGSCSRFGAALALLFSVIPAHAQVGFDEDADDKSKSWEEASVQLPSTPKAENLVSFNVSPTATQSFAIDVSSLTVGTDGVIRYTLVATSASGAKNISYEGIRCQTYERKLYAFGQADGTWVRSRRNTWTAIQGYAANRPHAALAKDYFCLEQTIAGTADDMVNRIRNKRTLAPQDDK